MASRIQSLGITLQTNTSVSPKSLVSGGNRQHLMEHCPGSPSPLLQALGGTKKAEELKRNWKRRGREERQRGKRERETRQDELCKAVRGGYCWRCWLCWREPALISTSSIYRSHHSPWLRAVWSVLRQTANNKMRGFGGVDGPVRPLGDRWIVLEGHTRNDKYALHYHYLQRSPTGRSELIRTAALRKYNYRTKAWWIVATSALWSAVATLVLLCVLK